jgi:hypothetical protein
MITRLGIGLGAGLALGSIIRWPFHRHQSAVGTFTTGQEAPKPPLRRRLPVLTIRAMSDGKVTHPGISNTAIIMPKESGLWGSGTVVVRSSWA